MVAQTAPAIYLYNKKLEGCMHFSLFLGSLSKKKKKKAKLHSTVLKCYFSCCLLQCSSSISRGGARRTENSITLPGEELLSGQGLESPSPLCVWGLRKGKGQGTATAKGCLCIPKDCFCPGSIESVGATPTPPFRQFS